MRGGGSYVERMVAVTAEGAKAEAAGPVKGKPCRLPGEPQATNGVGDIDINYTNFPDEKFRDYIETFDKDGDGKLSAKEIADVTKIVVNQRADIQDLTGIEHFTALETLNCSATGIGSLDVSRNQKLKSLNCGNTEIGNLDVSSNPNLETLNCYHTGIGSLNVSSNPKLIYLDCSNNTGLTNLKVESNRALESLYCNRTGIGSLNVSSNPKLTSLYCNRTGIGSLDVSSNPKLTYLSCNHTGIGSLDVSSNPALESLDCSDNASLTNLKIEGAAALESLYCNRTGIGSLDVSSNQKLTSLECSDTRIGSLDVSSNPDLEYLFCYDSTNLTNLKVEGAAALEDLDCDNTKIGSLDVSSNKKLTSLVCSDTRIGSLDVSRNKKLTTLHCYSNANLTNLKVEGAAALKYLSCNNTRIGSLDVSSNQKLWYLDCSNNPLAYLKIGTNNNLTDVYSTGLKPVDVTVTSDRFQMKDKFAGIDAGAVRDVKGATYNSGTMSNYRAGTPITYTYDCGTSSGGEVTIEVTLNITLGSTISITENLNKTYDGKAVSAAPTVSTEGSSGAVSFTWEREKGANTWEIINSAPTDAGTYQVTAALESDGTYKEAASEPVQFTIAPKDITTDSQIIVPNITADTDLDKLVIQDGDRVLVQGTDYDVTKTQDGANVTVAITGKGNYTGTITRTYTVEEKAPSGGVKDSDNNHDGTKTNKKTAQTGDPANVGVLAAMVLLSAGCMFVLIRKKGQKK